MNHAPVDGTGLPSCGLHKFDWHRKRNQKSCFRLGYRVHWCPVLIRTKRKRSVKLQNYANYFMVVLTWLILRVADSVDVLCARWSVLRLVVLYWILSLPNLSPCFYTGPNFDRRGFYCLAWSCHNGINHSNVTTLNLFIIDLYISLTVRFTGLCRQ